MGVYYHLYNLTRNEAVYGYFRFEVDKIEQIMHDFNWESTDLVFAMSGNSCYQITDDDSVELDFDQYDEIVNEFYSKNSRSPSDEPLKFIYEEEDRNVEHNPEWSQNLCIHCGQESKNKNEYIVDSVENWLWK